MERPAAASTPFFDSHAHLADPAFAADVDDAIARLDAAGGRGVICVGESLTAAARARALARSYPHRVWSTAGVHPHDAASFDATRDDELLREALAAGAVAVGECGLDYHYDHSPRDRQREAFTHQLALAAERGLPVIVHSRDAEEDTSAMVREAGAAGVRGVMHCFTGSQSLADTALAAGWSISFSGIITFRSWTDEALLRSVPIDRLLVESDSPYLAPIPHRGRRNEPAWVLHTLARLASARGAEPRSLGEATCDNTMRLFALATPPRDP